MLRSKRSSERSLSIASEGKRRREGQDEQDAKEQQEERKEGEMHVKS